MASKEIDYDSGSSFDSDSDSDDGAAMTFNLLEQANAKAFESSSHTLHHCKKLGGGLGKKKNKKNKGMLGGQNLFSSPRPSASESDLNEDGGDGDGDEGGFMSFGVTTETKLEGGNHQREEAKVEVEENAGASWDHGRRSHHEGVNPDHAAAAVAAVAAGAAAAAAAGSSDVVVEQDWKAEARARHEAAAVKAGKTKNLRTGRSVKMMATVVQKKKEKKQAAAAAAAAAPTVGSTMNENGDGDGFMSFEVNTEQRLQSGNTNRDHPAEEEEEDQEIMNFDDFFATTEGIKKKLIVFDIMIFF